MSLLQWILLIVAVAVVILLYLRIRRARDEDPWNKLASPEDARPDYEKLTGGPDESASEPDETGAYIVGEPRVISEAPARPAEPDIPPASAQMEKGWEHFSAARDDEQMKLDIPIGRKAAHRPPAAPPGEEKIIVLHVAAPEGELFTGPAVHGALQLCRLQFGMREVYHRITEANGVPEAVFSVANMVKPGFLDPAAAQDFTTPGLTLFMVMPGPVEGVVAYRDMLETAKKLSQRLGGAVLDDKRTPLTHQSEQYLHDEIAETERRWRVQPRKK